MGFVPSDYVPVADRVTKFRADHPDWGLVAELIIDEGNRIVMKATVTDENGRVVATGHAEERRDQGNVNRTSAIENGETSAWGRALAALGYEVKAGIASREEMEKAASSGGRQSGSTRQGGTTGPGSSAGPSSAPASSSDTVDMSEEYDAVSGDVAQNARKWFGQHNAAPKAVPADKADELRRILRGEEVAA